MQKAGLIRCRRNHFSRCLTSNSTVRSMPAMAKCVTTVLSAELYNRRATLVPEEMRRTVLFPGAPRARQSFIGHHDDPVDE